MTSYFRLSFSVFLIFVIHAAAFSQSQQAENTQQPESADWGGLKIHQVGVDLQSAARIVILMHGYGAPGRDLVPLGEALGGNNTCFVFPEAPHKMARGRAWWKERDDYKDSRRRIVELLQQVKKRNPQAKVLLGGFSQGAMLASNFLEKNAELVDGLILFSPSGRLREKLTGEIKEKPLVFLSHGRKDKVLPFSGSVELNKKLTQFQYQVDWLPFDGGHSIPREVLVGVSGFLTKFNN